MRRGTIQRMLLVVLAGMVALAGVGFAPSAMAQQGNASVLDKYLDKYWGEKRDIKVIQKRLFQKDGRHEFEPFFGVIPNDEFFVYYPVGVRYNYYFSEDIGVELWGDYIWMQKSDLEVFLNEEFRIKTTTPQVLKWMAGAEFLWSPIHGKIGLFTSKLSHFDLHVAVGAGGIGTTVRTREEGGQEKGKTDIGGNIGSGIRFYLNDWLALRFEYRHYFYAAEGGGVSYPAELSFGASFFTK